MPKPGFRGTHRDAAMLPGPTERLVPEAEGAMDEDRDPNPCEPGWNTCTGPATQFCAGFPPSLQNGLAKTFKKC